MRRLCNGTIPFRNRWRLRCARVFLMLGTVLQVAFQAIHARGDVFQRIGIGETQIAFRVGAKVDTGCDPHPRFFENAAPGRYSVKPMLRAAASRRQVTGELYRGEWHDVGTLERLRALE